MKPLKATIYGSFKNISKLAKQREISMEDKKINEDIRQKIEFLRVKMKALSNLLESYTVVLQAFLYGSDPLYFVNFLLYRKCYSDKIIIPNFVQKNYFSSQSSKSKIKQIASINYNMKYQAILNLYV